MERRGEDRSVGEREARGLDGLDSPAHRYWFFPSDSRPLRSALGPRSSPLSPSIVASFPLPLTYPSHVSGPSPPPSFPSLLTRSLFALLLVNALPPFDSRSVLSFSFYILHLHSEIFLYSIFFLFLHVPHPLSFNLLFSSSLLYPQFLRDLIPSFVSFLHFLSLYLSLFFFDLYFFL